MKLSLMLAAFNPLAATIAIAAGPGGFDFTREPEFAAHYAYLDLADGAPAQDFIGVSGRRIGKIWRIEAVGSNRRLAASARTCRKVFTGRTIGRGRLEADDPSGEFGRFELRQEGEMVRLISLVEGGCIRQGLYNLPRSFD